MTTDQLRAELAERQTAERAELRDQHQADRAALGLGPIPPLATWNAFSPHELIQVITGVTRMDPAAAEAIVRGILDGPAREFDTERRDIGGTLVGGARWQIERAGISSWKLHLLLAEACGAA